MWFWIWTGLAVATLVGAFFLGRWLWRRAVALGRELARAGSALEQLAERTAELQAIAQREARSTAPTVGADPGPLRERVAELREEAAGRRAARAERHRATVQGWRAYWR